MRRAKMILTCPGLSIVSFRVSGAALSRRSQARIEIDKNQFRALPGWLLSEHGDDVAAIAGTRAQDALISM